MTVPVPGRPRAARRRPSRSSGSVRCQGRCGRSLRARPVELGEENRPERRDAAVQTHGALWLVSCPRPLNARWVPGSTAANGRNAGVVLTLWQGDWFLSLAAFPLSAWVAGSLLGLLEPGGAVVSSSGEAVDH